MSSPLPDPLRRRLSPAWQARLTRWWPWLTPAAFVGGFLVDLATLRRVDDVGDNVQLTLYLLAAAALLILERRAWHGRRTWGPVAAHPALARLGLQFLFGGLFSAYFLFYTRSATLGPSLAFCLLLAGLMLANERWLPRIRHDGPQLALWFFSALSYLLFAVPTWTGSLHPATRWVAAALALLGLAAVVTAVHAGPVVDPSAPGETPPLRRALPRALGQAAVVLAGIVVGVQLGTIPPVPMALAEAGIYHRVERDGADVVVAWEPRNWRPWVRDDRVFRWHEGDRVHCYTAVFAPNDIELRVLHAWEHRAPDGGGWVETDRIPWQMAGGRDGGWRSWTAKRNVAPGDWRVRVLTEHGQELGRIAFSVVAADAPPRPLQEARR